MDRTTGSCASSLRASHAGRVISSSGCAMSSSQARGVSRSGTRAMSTSNSRTGGVSPSCTCAGGASGVSASGVGALIGAQGILDFVDDARHDLFPVVRVFGTVQCVESLVD